MAKHTPAAGPNDGLIDLAPQLGRIQVISKPRPPSAADEFFKENGPAIKNFFEKNGAKLDVLPPAALAEAANDLRTCRRVTPPILVEWFSSVLSRCRRDHGLVFPPPSRFSLAFVDAPDFREADGQTFLDQGTVTVFINVGAAAPHFVRTLYHEAFHAADLHRFGASLSAGELEKRADAFVARVFAPPRPAPAAAQVPKPEPVEVTVPAPYRGGRWTS